MKYLFLLSALLLASCSNNGNPMNTGSTSDCNRPCCEKPEKARQCQQAACPCKTSHPCKN